MIASRMKKKFSVKILIKLKDINSLSLLNQMLIDILIDLNSYFMRIGRFTNLIDLHCFKMQGINTINTHIYIYELRMITLKKKLKNVMYIILTYP